MAIITEDYVSFETAKLLKEKGFEGDITAYYHIWDNGSRVCSIQEFIHSEAPHLYISAPTLQMAMKWLREVHNIDTEVHADVGMLGVKAYTPFISRYKSSTEYPSKLRQYKNGLYFEDDRGMIPGIRHFETYEQACEAAIKYCLEHLI